MRSGGLLRIIRGVKVMLLVAGALVASALLTGCTGSARRPAAAQSAVKPVPPAPETGVATGEVPLCVGVVITSAVRPQAVTVQARHGGEVVATQQVTSSGKRPGRYRFVLAPGRYSIAAPREYDGPTVAHVSPGSTVTADLVNGCK